MELQEKSFECFDCGQTYVFSVEEQQAFQSKGYTNHPKRCPACRQARKERQGNNGVRNDRPVQRSEERQLFTVVCSQCGQSTQVPFEPRAGRPVYCRSCYNSVKVSK